MWGETPIMALSIFVECTFFFNIYSFQKFDLSSSNGLKVKNFGGLYLGVFPQPDTPKFSQALVLPDMFNRSNFEYSALSSLEVGSWRKKVSKKKKDSIKVGVNEHN